MATLRNAVIVARATPAAVLVDMGVIADRLASVERRGGRGQWRVRAGYAGRTKDDLVATE